MGWRMSNENGKSQVRLRPQPAIATPRGMAPLIHFKGVRHHYQFDQRWEDYQKLLRWPRWVWLVGEWLHRVLGRFTE